MKSVNADNFDAEVLKSDKLVLVDFWAEWCAPCKMITPVLSRLSEKYEGKVEIVKVNVDEEFEVAGKYAIASIPNLLFFRDGEVVDQSVGYSGEATLSDKINAMIN